MTKMSSNVLRWSAGILILGLLVWLAVRFPTGADNDKPAPDVSPTMIGSKNGNTHKSVDGRLLLKFASGVNDQKKKDVMTKHGLKEESEIAEIGVKIMSFPAADDTPDEVALRLMTNEKGIFEFAEPDAIAEPALIPNDLFYANGEWGLKKTQHPTAWDITTGSSSIVIADLDTGIDATHPDLINKLVPGWSTYDNTSDISDPNLGHGTVTAGTAAAQSNNTIGVSSGCWQCKIMPIRISSHTDGTATYSAISKGLIWAADHGARVANISYDLTVGSGYSTLASSATYFMDKARGVITNSAGNTGTERSLANSPYFITVSGTNSSDALAPVSSFGSYVDMAAPISDWTTVDHLKYVTTPYGSQAGTSISSPFVASAAGLALSANPDLSGYQLRDIIFESADDLGTAGYDKYFGWGRLNATKLVTMAKNTVVPSPSPVASPTPAVSPSPSPSPSPTPAGLTITSFSVSDKTSTTATITWTTNLPSTGIVNYGPSTKGSINLSLSANDSTSSTSHSLTLTNLTPATTYTYQITATDGTDTSKSTISSFKTARR